MWPIRAHHRIGLLVFMLFAILALGSIGTSLYSSTSQETSNKQVSKEATIQETTADTTLGGTQPESTASTGTVPQKTGSATVTPGSWVSAIGDSVMLGAAESLLQEIPNLALIDAQGSRQPPAAIDVLRQRSVAGQLGEEVVFHVGNNGPFTAEHFDAMMRVLADVRTVLVVNLSVPPGVEDPIAVPNNAVLTDGVQRYPNAVLVDWHAVSTGHPEYFGEDNTHLTLKGAQAYAGLVAAALGGPEEGSVESPGPRETISWGEGGSSGKCIGPPSWCVAVTP